jgi:hypothetical protein
VTLEAETSVVKDSTFGKVLMLGEATKTTVVTIAVAPMPPLIERLAPKWEELDWAACSLSFVLESEEESSRALKDE